MHFNMIEPDSSCCNSEYLCGENEGDCDTDSQCKDGLRCGMDNCGDGWPDSTWDCCSRCNSQAKRSDCCNAEYPCLENEGDCDSDDDCDSGLFCGENNCGKDWPGSTWDCCTSSK